MREDRSLSGIKYSQSVELIEFSERKKQKKVSEVTVESLVSSFAHLLQCLGKNITQVNSSGVQNSYQSCRLLCSHAGHMCAMPTFKAV